MVRTASRHPTPVLAVLVCALAAAAVLLGAGPAAGAGGDCTLSATEPASYYGIATIASGSVDCTSTKNVLRFSITLTRDGTVVDSHERTCHKAATCWSYSLVDDPAGDQVWCTRVSARVGSSPIGELTRCETDPAL
jgi:hypothetical protein